jgi:hypothetical protein
VFDLKTRTGQGSRITGRSTRSRAAVPPGVPTYLGCTWRAQRLPCALHPTCPGTPYPGALPPALLSPGEGYPVPRALPATPRGAYTAGTRVPCLSLRAAPKCGSGTRLNDRRATALRSTGHNRGPLLVGDGRAQSGLVHLVG